LPYVAVNKDAFPTSLAYATGCLKSVRLPKTSTGFSRDSLKRNYQAFVRFAVGSSAALSAIALN
jgi:hypothetical protein